MDERRSDRRRSATGRDVLGRPGSFRRAARLAGARDDDCSLPRDAARRARRDRGGRENRLASTPGVHGSRRGFPSRLRVPMSLESDDGLWLVGVRVQNELTGCDRRFQGGQPRHANQQGLAPIGTPRVRGLDQLASELRRHSARALRRPQAPGKRRRLRVRGGRPPRAHAPLRARRVRLARRGDRPIGSSRTGRRSGGRLPKSASRPASARGPPRAGNPSRGRSHSVEPRRSQDRTRERVQTAASPVSLTARRSLADSTRSSQGPRSREYGPALALRGPSPARPGTQAAP